MTRLLLKMCDLVETTKLSPPVAYDYAPKPTANVVEAAKRMVASGRTTLHQIAGETRLLVKHTRRNGEYETTDIASFTLAFDKHIEISKKEAASKRRGVVADAAKLKAAQLYKQAVSWSLWRSHCKGMPASGWTVDYGCADCTFKYFSKFMVCAHLLIAQNRHDVTALGKPRKIVDRSRSQADRARDATFLFAHPSQRDTGISLAEQHPYLPPHHAQSHQHQQEHQRLQYQPRQPLNLLQEHQHDHRQLQYQPPHQNPPDYRRHQYDDQPHQRQHHQHEHRQLEYQPQQQTSHEYWHQQDDDHAHSSHKHRLARHGQ